MLYVDYNATSPTRPEVTDLVCDLAASPGNPSSLHRFGQNARRRLDDTRDILRAWLDGADARVVFTAGGTEADQLALRGLALRQRALTGADYIVLSRLEHPGVIANAEILAREGFRLCWLEVDQQGRCALPEDLPIAPKEVACATLMWANNETGVIQPVQAWGAWSQSHNVPFHIDAVQAIGKVPVSFTRSCATSLALSAHKFGGPKGIGALVLRAGTEVESLWQGGGQEYGLRPGTQGTALIAGMGRAALLCQTEGGMEKLRPLKHELAEYLRSIHPVQIVGDGAPALPNTLAVAVEGITSKRLCEAMARRGVFMGAGSACHAEKDTPSMVLQAMGWNDDLALNVIRISFGPDFAEPQLRKLKETLEGCIKECRV
jgi:cysteine desulfurase